MTLLQATQALWHARIKLTGLCRLQLEMRSPLLQAAIAVLAARVQCAQVTLQLAGSSAANDGRYGPGGEAA